LVAAAVDVVILLAIQAVTGALLGNLPRVRLVSGLVLALAYLAGFWAVAGQSVGMMVFGLRVRDPRTGGFPGPGRALGRAIFWLLELGATVVLVGAVGWLWMLWDGRRQALHDKVAGTLVTRA
jgi:uncharacterized RDD family membrane protein YckC